MLSQILNKLNNTTHHHVTQYIHKLQNKQIQYTERAQFPSGPLFPSQNPLNTKDILKRVCL